MLSTPQIFLAEDDDDDAFLFEFAFKKCLPDCQIKVFPSGAQLLEGLNTQTITPTYVFLDINLPTMNGFDVLASMRDSPQTANIPIFFITSSDFETDIERSMKLCANDYFIKPNTYKDILKLAESIKTKWFGPIYA